jgi:hypothetical protein
MVSLQSLAIPSHLCSSQRFISLTQGRSQAQRNSCPVNRRWFHIEHSGRGNFENEIARYDWGRTSAAISYELYLLRFRRDL